jgi:hypothetical protein
MSNEVLIVAGSEVLDPVLTQICNMDLSKKDVLEILEVETLQEIEKEEAEISARIKTLENVKRSLNHEMEIEDEKEKEEIKKLFSSKVDPIFGKIEFQVNLEFGYPKQPFNCVDYVAPDKIFAKVSGSNDYTNIGSRKCIVHETGKAYQKKVLTLNAKVVEISKQISNEYAASGKIQERKRNLPKILKEFSAELSKRALDSTEKGKGVISILRSIRAKAAPQQIECTVTKSKGCRLTVTSPETKRSERSSQSSFFPLIYFDLNLNWV